VNPLFAAAVDLQGFFEVRRWRFCFIGGLAVQRWGEPRLTLDVDCTLLTGFGQEARYVDELLAAFPGRVDDSRGFALSNRVLLLHGRSRIPLDVALGAMPFEERCVERASPFDIGQGHALLTCSAEDLIVFKAFAGRDRDWLDIETIILRQRGTLDLEIVWKELTPLLELTEDREARPRLERLLTDAASHS
jgi:Nucleotidyltransferase of unknown function (DUF6036)